MTSFPAPTSSSEGLYRIYDAESRLLYVGISRSPLHRTQVHRNRSPWWPLAVTWSVEWFPSRQDVRLAEGRAIRTEGPLYNSDYNGLFRGTASDARSAIPAHLERKPIEWPAHVSRPAPKPYRIQYLNCDPMPAVASLTMAAAESWAQRLVAEYPALACAFAAEANGVPTPWGNHAVVAYGVRNGLVSLDALKTE